MQKKYGRISEKITLSMAVRVVAITAAVTALSFYHISSIVSSLTKENLEKYIAVRGERESQTFSNAMRDQKLLAKRLLKNLQTENSHDLEQYSTIFLKSLDGATRERREIDNVLHPSFLIPKFIPITNEVKIRSIKMYDFLDRECFMSLGSFSDCWIADAEGAYGVFLPDENGYADRTGGDFRNLDQEWMKGILPKDNPEGVSKWTKAYLDPNIKMWMITLSTPIYEGSHFFGAIGNDIVIGQLFDRTIHTGMEGTKNFIFNSDGTLIAHPDYQDKISRTGAHIQIGDFPPDSILAKTFHLSQTKSLDHESVFDLDSKYLIAITKMSGPDWYLATLYPKSKIHDASLYASSYVLGFGIISLFLEIALLMIIIRRKLDRPLHDIVTGVKKVGSGDLQVKIHTGTQDELELLGDAFNDMTYNLELSRSESKQAVERAIEASQAKSDFVANMSHEIRTPLSGILGMAHVLSEGDLSEEQKQYTRLINESGNNLLSIVNQVLDVAKIEAKKYELDEVFFDLPKILQEVKSSFYFVAKQKGIPLDFNNLVQNDDLFWGDSTRIKQVLMNFVGNALKFSTVGSVTIQVETLDIQDGKQALRFSVRDQGIGIPSEIQKKLFQPFSQADSSTSRKFGGTGLGLYLSRSIIEMMNGKIGVKSEVGIGTEFWFEITLTIRAKKEQEKEVIFSEDTLDFSQVKPVLVAEDTPANQIVTELLLRKMGLSCKIRNNGKETVDAFREGEYSMVLMDCQMPVMDGYEATQEIRKLETSGNRIPIVALTANSLKGDKEKCLESGMDDMLSKPVRIPVFREKIEYWIRKTLAEESEKKAKAG